MEQVSQLALQDLQNLLGTYLPMLPLPHHFYPGRLLATFLQCVKPVQYCLQLLEGWAV